MDTVLLKHIVMSIVVIFVGTWYMGTVLMLVIDAHKALNITIPQSIKFKRRVRLELFRVLCLMYYVLWIYYFYISYKLIWIH